MRACVCVLVCLTEPFSYLDVIHHVRLCVEMMLPDLANTAARGGGLLKLVLRLPNGSTLDGKKCLIFHM